MLDFNSVPPVANAVGGDLNAQRDAIRADLLALLDWAMAQGGVA